MNGMNPEPCASYSLAERFVCGKCGLPPEIEKAEGSDPIVVTFSCHGARLTKSYSKSELVFTQRVFEES